MLTALAQAHPRVVALPHAIPVPKSVLRSSSFVSKHSSRQWLVRAPICSNAPPQPNHFTRCRSLAAGTRGGFVTAATATAPLAFDHNRPLQKLQLILSETATFLTERDELLVVAVSTLLCSMSHSALRPVLPMFAKSFGVGTAAVGMTMSTYALARLMMNLPAGILADRHGRKLLLVWGPALTALGMFGCGRAGSFQHLLAWRWVTGLGSALQMSGSQLCLADISRTNTRARCLGTNQAASQIGSFLGPVLGGVVADEAGFRALFTFTTAAALLAALCVLLRLPAGASKARATKHQNTQYKAPCVQPSLGEGRQTGKPAVQVTMAKDAKPEWSQLLLCRNFGSIALVSAVMFMTQNGARAVLLPLLAMQRFGMSAKLLGTIFSAMAVVSLTLVLPASMAADRLGRKWTIIPSCLGMAAALGLMALSGLSSLMRKASLD
ncbi:hypothetical protein ABBQ32_013083 [Trebouxia sp. C0010 RCD-2024]